MVFRAMWKYIPNPILELVKYIPSREYARSRDMLGVVNRVSKQLIDEKAAALLDGDKSRRDIMSVLGTTNLLSTLNVPDSRTVLSACECIGGPQDEAR